MRYIGPAAAAAGVFVLAGYLLWPATPAVCLLGDVRGRLAGEVPAALHEHYVDAAPIAAGFGSAAIGGWDSLGDALAVGGQLYLRTTHAASPNYFRVVRNRYFQTNHFVYVPRGAPPSATLGIERRTDLGALWEDLAARFRDGVLVEGYLWMETLHAIAIAHPAIDDGPIPRQAVRFYTHPMETAHGTWAYVVGIAARPTRPSWWRKREILQRAVRRNPDTGYDGSAHALRLREAPGAPGASPDPAMVESLGEVLPSSVATRGRLRLYPLNSVASCK
ncbi:MAG TPA: hypothetical protein VGA00_04060 [Acidiferrobacterales bacterium]|jgi:hypothetical protein